MEIVQSVNTLLGLRLSQSDEPARRVVGVLFAASSALLWGCALFLAIEKLVHTSRRGGSRDFQIVGLILCFGGIAVGAMVYRLPEGSVGETMEVVIKLLQVVFPLLVCLTYSGDTIALAERIWKRVRAVFCSASSVLPITTSSAIHISTTTASSIEMATKLSMAISTAIAGAIPVGSRVVDASSSMCTYDGRYTVTSGCTISTAPVPASSTPVGEFASSSASALASSSASSHASSSASATSSSSVSGSVSTSASATVTTTSAPLSTTSAQAPFPPQPLLP